jgi:hypothetical protein
LGVRKLTFWAGVSRADSPIGRKTGERSVCPRISPYFSSVGIAIGHANIKRLVGEFANLSIWIN